MIYSKSLGSLSFIFFFINILYNNLLCEFDFNVIDEIIIYISNYYLIKLLCQKLMKLII